jgi:pyruvate,orthophosphate dikinase
MVFLLGEVDQAKAYMGNNWENIRGLLGGKGANLAGMACLGVLVPPFITITTEACSVDGLYKRPIRRFP